MQCPLDTGGVIWTIFVSLSQKISSEIRPEQNGVEKEGEYGEFHFKKQYDTMESSLFVLYNVRGFRRSSLPTSLWKQERITK